MSETTDRSADDEDRISLKSNEKTPSKKTVGRFQSFRKSLRHAVKKTPLLSAGKGSKGTSKVASASDDSGSPGLPPPPSPSLTSGSPLNSPLKKSGDSFQKEEEDEANAAPQKSKPVISPKTVPSMSSLGDSFLKRGETIRRSLGFGPKNKDKNCMNMTSESSFEEKDEENEEQEEKVYQEMEETYSLPEIPHTPLSVMQINKLIEMGLLEEAHVNLLAVRQEFQREQERCGEDSSMELAKKEKDLNLLYRDLRSKISAIVRESNNELPVSVSRIIQEEEKRAEEPGGLVGWMETWRKAVAEGVQVKVDSVPLEQVEQNSSWLAVHLGWLRKAIVEDLENVKTVVRWSYPPSFKVFSTYVKSYHRVIGQHLKKLEPQVTELKDLYALLDWIINTYKSERIMGSASLQPDMKDESTDLQLEENFLKQLEEKYCCRVKEDLNHSLDRLIELENEEVWRNSKSLKKEDSFFDSQFHMDIWRNIEGFVVNTRKIGALLEQKVTSSCLQELKHFPPRFETEFKHHCGALKPQPLWTEYHITYINSFTALQQHMDGYEDACPEEVEGFRREVKWLIVRLMQVLEDQFKEDVKPHLRTMMTRKWLTNDADFQGLYDRTNQLSRHCSLMRPPHAQEFANHLHYHMVKEYVGQLMKSNYSCRNRKHEKAATKIRQQWRRLTELFEEMKSTQEWLYPAGDDLSDIIGQKNKADIKQHLERLVDHYPDFSRKHLVAVLNFRGLLRGREHQLILQRLKELRMKLGSESSNRSRSLFHDMQVTTNTDCLSNLPLSCFTRTIDDSD